MDDPPEPAEQRAGPDAATDLARIQAKVDAARALLVRLLQDLVLAESRLSVSPSANLVDANEALVNASLRSQAEAEAAAQAVREMATSAGRDLLTQLPNRALLCDRLAQAIAGASRHETHLAVLFLDLDNFKRINDTLGHAVGDEVLQKAAHRIAGAVRASDTVGRYGGDEFLILLPELAQAADAVGTAKKVLAGLEAEVLVDGHALDLKASIGISIYPQHGGDAAALIRAADAAMYRAKRWGKAGFAVQGEAAEGEGMPASLAWEAGHADAAGPDASRQELRNAQLREANEQLVLAALDAQALQAAAEKAQRRQSEFLAVVAQELRDPLAPIRIATAMLGRFRVDEPLMPRVQAIIERQAAQMSRLLDEIPEDARGGARTLHVQPQRVDIADAVDDAIATCSTAIALRHQRLAKQLCPDPLVVAGERSHLALVFSNLLENACRFTPEGGHLSVATARTGGFVVVTVADDGMGIAPQLLPTVFEPFVQDARVMGLEEASLGLGLTVVRALVQAYGGSVSASSEGSGKGSRFVVSLPESAPAA